MLSRKQIQKFRTTIYAYYTAHGRETLPWRRTKDPYRIMISEFMLQQTQVVRVLYKYKEFLERFPNVKALSQASLKDVLAVWSGLGYNRRALMLKRAADIIIEKHTGKIPDDFDALRKLPGIGNATAGEICAFAFNKAHPFIETNIRAVYIHFFFKEKENVTDDELMPYIEKTLDMKDPRTWYYALFDYGVFLKQQNNASRQSAHYTKQSIFKGSDRQLRGKILKILLKKAMTERQIITACTEDEERVRKLLKQLRKEKMIIIRNNMYVIP